MGIMSLITGASALAGIGEGIYSMHNAQQNFELQKQNLAYQKEMQEKSWARDDNAVQRRAIDLQNAGLSKTLAAGSAAGNSGVIATNAAQRLDPKPQFSQTTMNSLGLMMQAKNIEQTAAQTALIRMQEAKAQKEMVSLDLANSGQVLENIAKEKRNLILGYDLTSKEISNKSAQQELEARRSDLEKLNELGFISTTSGTALQVLNAINAIKKSMGFNNIDLGALGDLGHAAVDQVKETANGVQGKLDAQNKKAEDSFKQNHPKINALGEKFGGWLDKTFLQGK